MLDPSESQKRTPKVPGESQKLSFKTKDLRPKTGYTCTVMLFYAHTVYQLAFKIFMLATSSLNQINIATTIIIIIFNMPRNPQN